MAANCRAISCKFQCWLFATLNFSMNKTAVTDEKDSNNVEFGLNAPQLSTRFTSHFAATCCVA
jgi:hypothetical protein